MTNVITAPEKYTISKGFSIFLAGSIENGTASNWQKELIEKYLWHDHLTILNPRRDNWDKQADNQKIIDQIRWEQDAIKLVDLVVFYFDPKTKSPISLLELGQCLERSKATTQQSPIVYCTKDFYRFTNVDETCNYYRGANVYQFKDDWYRSISLAIAKSI